MGIIDLEPFSFGVKLLQYVCVLGVVFSFFRAPRYGFALFFFLLPMWSFGSITSGYYAGLYLEFLNIVPRTFAVTILFLLSVYYYVLKNAPTKIPVVLLVLTSIGFLGVLSNNFPTVSVLLFVHGLVEPLLLVFAMRICLKNRRDVGLILGGWIVGLTIGLLFGIVNLIVKLLSGDFLDVLFGWDNPIAQVFGGVPFLVPQIAILLPILIQTQPGGLIPSSIVRHKLGIVVFLMASLVLTLKRGAMIVFILSLLFAACRAWKLLLSFRRLALLCLIGTFITLYFASLTKIADHGKDIFFSSPSLVRLELYSNMASVIDGRYLFGIGMGQYRDPVHITSEGTPMDSPHNILLHLLAENGIVFLMVFLLLIGSVCLKYFIYYKRQRTHGVISKEMFGIVFGIGLFFLFSVAAEGGIAHAYRYQLNNEEIIGVKNSGFLAFMLLYAIQPLLKTPFPKPTGLANSHQ